jgi:hypothetical protein
MSDETSAIHRLAANIIVAASDLRAARLAEEQARARLIPAEQALAAAQRTYDESRQTLAAALDAAAGAAQALSEHDICPRCGGARGRWPACTCRYFTMGSTGAP